MAAVVTESKKEKTDQETQLQQAVTSLSDFIQTRLHALKTAWPREASEEIAPLLNLFLSLLRRVVSATYHTIRSIRRMTLAVLDGNGDQSVALSLLRADCEENKGTFCILESELNRLHDTEAHSEKIGNVCKLAVECIASLVAATFRVAVPVFVQMGVNASVSVPVHNLLSTASGDATDSKSDNLKTLIVGLPKIRQLLAHTIKTREVDMAKLATMPGATGVGELCRRIVQESEKLGHYCDDISQAVHGLPRVTIRDSGICVIM